MVDISLMYLHQYDWNIYKQSEMIEKQKLIYMSLVIDTRSTLSTPDWVRGN